SLGSQSPSEIAYEAEEISLDELKYSRFLAWMTHHGATFPHLTLRRYAKDYRGVHISTSGKESPQINQSEPQREEEEKTAVPREASPSPSTADASVSVEVASSPGTGPSIPKGVTLLSIPHALLITVELARASPMGGMVSHLPNLGSQAI